MDTLNGVNTSQTEAQHKSVKEAYRNSNKVDYVAQMCFWDDRRLAVEMREAKVQYLAVEEVGNWSQKIGEKYCTQTQFPLTPPSLGGLQY
jgi:hypothetical protein